MKIPIHHQTSLRKLPAALGVAAAFLTTSFGYAQTLDEPFRRTTALRSEVIAPSAGSPSAADQASPSPTASVFTRPVSASETAPAVVAPPMETTDGEYVLSMNDAIEMTVFREPDLTTRATISRDGTVQFPLINDVKVAGLTIKQARNLIRERYNADYLVEPQISLGVSKFADRKFTIIGQVNSPGTYAIAGGEEMNLIGAIGMAGGFTRIADRRNVIVKRTVGGKSQTIKVSAKRMTESSQTPIAILAGDVISVGESWY